MTNIQKNYNINNTQDFLFNKLNLLPKSKLKFYLNKQHKNILWNLFNQEKYQDKEEYLKQNFIKNHFNKSHDKVIELLYDDSIGGEFPDYYKNLILLLASHNLDEENFHKELEKINEKTFQQKSNGVYYTPEDISSFIVNNSIIQYLNNDCDTVLRPLKNIDSYIEYLIQNNTKKILCNKIASISIFDPACGTGAFLIKTIETKFNLIQKIDRQNSKKYLYQIVKNLFGNDIDAYSNYITKVRILFKCLSFDSNTNAQKIYSHLDSNFSGINIVSNSQKIKKKFDIVIGNPPYVEKSKVRYSKQVKYGNIYADVVHNSIGLINQNGILGMIIPISYISTKRMRPIRKYVEINTSVQFILSYADRPDCLFTGVHQKLNIVFARKNKEWKHSIFTTDYKFWSKKQRGQLFNKIEFVKNTHSDKDFYPKLKNDIELKIYKKIIKHSNTIINLQSEGNHHIYLNKRSCFWTKSFISKPLKDSEYSKYTYSYEYQSVCNCALNSNLFWWFWIKVSDCWHITNKELDNFKIPMIHKDLFFKFNTLSKNLEYKLQITKNKINTKQTMYEYKHNKCLDEIDNINDLLANIYSLNKQEAQYIKYYNQDYRLSK